MIRPVVRVLTNDALLVAVMHAYGLTLLASSDADLDRMPGITRYPSLIVHEWQLRLSKMDGHFIRKRFEQDQPLSSFGA